MNRDLLDLAGSGDLQAVAEELKKHPADVNMRGEFGYSTPLMQAVSEDHADVAALLLDNGAEINAQDDQNATALIWAASMGAGKCVRLLLERGADWRMADVKGETAFDAARRGSMNKPALAAIVDAIAARMEQGAATPPHKPEPAGAATVIAAAAHGHAGKLRAIVIDHPAAVNWKEPVTGATALRNAVAYAKLENADVAWLIGRGADIDARDNGGWTPLMHALQRGESTVFVEPLLAAGANPLLKNTAGETALDIARRASPEYAGRLAQYALCWQAHEGTHQDVSVSRPPKFRRAP